MTADQRDKIKSCVFIIRHYLKQAADCRDWYDNLADFYIVYDHYMTCVEYYEKELDKIYDNK